MYNVYREKYSVKLTKKSDDNQMIRSYHPRPLRAQSIPLLALLFFCLLWLGILSQSHSLSATPLNQESSGSEEGYPPPVEAEPMQVEEPSTPAAYPEPTQDQPQPAEQPTSIQPTLAPGYPEPQKPELSSPPAENGAEALPTAPAPAQESRFSLLLVGLIGVVLIGAVILIFARRNQSS